MQRAAVGLASAVLDLLGRAYGARVLLLVGGGDNGGDALYAGALLARRGCRVSAWLLWDQPHAAGLTTLVRGRGAGSSPGAPAGAAGPRHRRDRRHRWEARAAAGRRRRAGGAGGHAGRRGRRTFRRRRGHRRARRAGGASRRHGHLRHAQGGPCWPTRRRPAPASCTSSRCPRPVGSSSRRRAVESPAGRPTSRRCLPRPEPDAHKYARGVVGVRAGSATYPGAGVLCVAGAASAAWCGTVPLRRRVPASRSSSAHPDVVVGNGRVQAWTVGSGGGPDVATMLAEAQLGRRARPSSTPTALALVDGPLTVPSVLTPHAGELSRMTGRAPRGHRGPRHCATPARRRRRTTRWCCSRAGARSSPAPAVGRSDHRPPECPGSPRPVRATCCPGWSVRCSPPASTRTTRRRSARGCTAPRPLTPLVGGPL